MKNLTIYYRRGEHQKHYRIVFNFLRWFLIPEIGHTRGYIGRGYPIKVLRPAKDNARWMSRGEIAKLYNISQFEEETVRTRYASGKVLRFLFIRVYYIRWEKNDAGKIYPSRYNYWKETLEESKFRWASLVESGFFID